MESWLIVQIENQLWALWSYRWTRQNYCMKCITIYKIKLTFENTTLLKNYIVPTTTNKFSANFLDWLWSENTNLGKGLELVSKQLNHFGVFADLFRQIGVHSSRFVLFCTFWRLFTIKMMKNVTVFPFSFWKIIIFFFHFIKIKLLA